MKITSTNNKIATIQVLKGALNYSLKEAKELAEGEGEIPYSIELYLDLCATGATLSGIPKVEAWMVEGAIARANRSILGLAQRIAMADRLLPSLLREEEGD